MQTETIDINLLKPNPINPRTITKESLEKLKKSITDLPEMLELRPIVVGANNVVLGGNQRLKALKSLGYKEYEPFLGTGSTLIACENTNRVCYGMELDPIYIDVIIKRWEDYTGKKAKKISQSKNTHKSTK